MGAENCKEMLEIRLTLNRNAIERFCRWGKCAMIFEALALAVPLAISLIWWGRWGMGNYLLIGGGVLLGLLPTCVGITKFAFARKLRSCRAVTFGPDRITLEHKGAPQTILYSEILLSYIQTSMPQMFNMGRCDMFVFRTRTCYCVLSDLFFEDTAASREAFKTAKIAIDQPPESS